MRWQYTPYIIPLLISTVICATLAFYAWRRRSTAGAEAFAMLMLAVAGWSLAYALELASADLSTSIFWAKVKYIGIGIVPVAWLIFALEYTNQGFWLTHRNLILLAIIPVVTVLLMWTNETHDLIWTQPQLDTSGPFITVSKTFGEWFWVHLAYSYVLLLIGTISLVRMLLRSPHIYRQQANMVLIGVAIPWIVNIVSIFGMSQVPNLDLTPFAFTLTGIAFSWAFFRYRLLDIAPIARRTVVEDMREGMIVLDTKNRVVDINPAAQNVVGFNSSEAIGKTDTQIFLGFPDLAGQLHQTTEATIEVKVDRGEDQRDLGVHISPLHDKKNHFNGRLIIIRDITQRKQAETEREHLLGREQEQRLLAETLQEVTLVLASQTSLKAVLDEVLRQTQRLVPYRTAHIMLLEGDRLRIAAWQGYQDFGSEDLISKLVQPLADFPIDAKVIRTTQAIVIPDTEQDLYWVVHEETAWVKSHLVAPLTLQDRVLGLLRLDGDTSNQFSVQDVQYLAPLANAAAIALENARLLASEQHRSEELASLIAAATAVSASLDMKQVLQIVAKQMAKLLAVDACAISKWDKIDKTLTLWVEHAPKNWETEPKWTYPIDLPDYPLIYKALRKVRPIQLQNGDLNVDDAEYNYMARANIVSLLIIPLAVQNRIIGLAQLMDLQKARVFSEREIGLIQTLANQAAIAIENAQLMATEQQRVEQLAMARDRALEASRLKSELLGRVSHELRTPLGVIIGYTEMLHDSVFGDISEEQRDTMQRIIDSAIGLSNRVNDLLDQAQLEANTLKLINEPIAPVDIIGHIQLTLGPQAGAKLLQLSCKIADDVPVTLYGDIDRLCQILSNLVDNAIKFTERGKVEVCIYCPDEDHWALQIIDTGLGISAEAQAHVFEPFWQLDSSSTRKYGGTGLGLSIVKQLTDLMKGRIYLESQLHQGSTFTVLLPLEPVPEMIS